MTPTTPLALAVDLGGTKIAATAVDTTGALVLPKVKVPTPAHEGADAVLDAMARAIDSCRERVDHASVTALGIGAAGAIDVDRGVVVSATDTMSGWRGADIITGLRARLPWASDLPIHVQNDVDAHAVGESWRGAGAGASSMLMLAVGTGIGAAFCRDGDVMRGAHHMAGEVGNLLVDVVDQVVDSGRHPFEHVAAGPAILRTYRALGGTAEAARGQDVMQLALRGDALAEGVVRALGRRVGRVLAWLTLVLDPAVVVLGGGVPTSPSPWWSGMEDELRGGLPQALRDVPVRRATQRNNAALLGAARDAFRLAGVPTTEED